MIEWINIKKQKPEPLEIVLLLIKPDLSEINQRIIVSGVLMTYEHDKNQRYLLHDFAISEDTSYIGFDEMIGDAIDNITHWAPLNLPNKYGTD
jgi:hypothetical protein